MKKVFFYDTKFGKIGIAEENDSLTDLFLNDNLTNAEITETPILRQAVSQLDEYFSGTRKFFNLPINPKGTEFQLKVWQALREIPYGETRSYKNIAQKIGNPNASRAVGLANNKNPLLIITPCHRVIGANGNLTGFALGLDVKKELLDLEASIERYKPEN